MCIIVPSWSRFQPSHQNQADRAGERIEWMHSTQLYGYMPPLIHVYSCPETAAYVQEHKHDHGFDTGMFGCHGEPALFEVCDVGGHPYAGG